MSDAGSPLILSLLGVAFATAATPGPNNILVLGSSAVFGRRRALPVYLGVCLGFPFMVLVVGFMTHLFGAQLLHGLKVVKWVGAAFLLYLAWKIFMAEPTRGEDAGDRPAGFWQVVALQWLNPKAWGMAISTTVMAGEAWYLPFLIYQIVIFPAVGLWFFSGDLLRIHVLGTRYERWLNRIMGLLLAGSVILLVM